MNKSGVVENTYDFITKKSLISEGDSLLLAVSGGPDSVALLRILDCLKKELGIRIAVFHLDHQIRKNSYKDDAFVQALAKKLGYKYVGLKYDVTAFAEKQKLSLQEAARIIRYRLLEKQASKLGADKIATGHQANDQVETFFLRLMRGAALTGLQGIPSKRGIIIRPLLNVPRNELIGYLKQIKQPFLTDPSNVKPAYLRNRVRNKLMPVIKKLNPSYMQVLLKNIELINEEESLLDCLAAELSDKLLEKEGNFFVIHKDDFLSLATAIKRRLVRQAICSAKGDLRQIESKHVEIILEKAARFGFTLELPSGLLFYSDYNVLRFGSVSAFKPKKIRRTAVKVGQKTDIKQTGNILEAIRVQKCDGGPLVACLDYTKIKPPLTVRSRQAGDRFQPLGVKGTKKLQDYFVDAKIPKFLRDSIVIVEDREKIVWVAGYQIDERAKIDKSTKHILRLELR